MRQFLVISMLLFSVAAVFAQTPQVSNPVCAYCGVSLTSGESHKPGCKYYEAPRDDSEYTSTSTSHSTHLNDYTPLQEVKSELNVSPERYEMLYKVGVGDYMITCPSCRSVVHEGWCLLAKFQKAAVEAKAKALAATTPQAREAAIQEFHQAEYQLNVSYEISLEGYHQRDEHVTNAPLQQPAYHHLSSAEIRNGYDKKLGYDSWATAYGKTFPNGEELWVLYDMDGKEVGQFSKVEPNAVPGGMDVFLVRDFNGRWGVYNAGGYAIAEPKFESVKVVVAQQEGVSREFYDVTMRDERGVQRHGIINGSVGGDDNQIIPCACDRIELIDRSPASHGILAKITVQGQMGVVDADSGEVLIQPAFSYVNTYFTRKGMFLIVGDGTNFGAYFAETMDEVVSLDSGKTLNQVRNIIDQKSR